MFAEYIDRAMESAVYDILQDDGTYWVRSLVFRGYGPATPPWRDAGGNCVRRSAIGWP